MIITSKRNHGALCCLALAFFTAASPIQAAPITGVTAATDMGSQAGSVISQIVDGSGLSAYLTSATHAAAIPSNSWASTIGVSTGTVTFNLGGLYNLDGMAVWNFNSDNRASVNAVTVAGSTNGVTFSTIGGAPGAFAIGASNASELAQIFSFSTTASFIRFTIAGNYGGGGSTGTGLSEVMFTGTTATPEPASWALIGTGLTALAYLRRRRVQINS